MQTYFLYNQINRQSDTSGTKMNVDNIKRNKSNDDF